MTVSIETCDAEYSTLGTDPDLHELVEEYVNEMPDRMAALGAAFKSGDLELLRRNAHQMKGAAGSYGFGQVTPYAAALD
jgi:HPt (histidine-containing phosphotransfer) domain-containing protein